MKCLLLPATRWGVVCLRENRMCIRQTPDCLYTLTLVQDLRLHNLGFFLFIFFACIMEEFQPVATHHSWPPLQFPEIIHKRRNHSENKKMTERNNLQRASGKHLTWGRMTTISLSQARVNLFCWGKKKKGKLCPEIFFCLLQIQPSVFCHLSLNKMSHADWESSGNGGIQFIYRPRPEPL